MLPFAIITFIGNFEIKIVPNLWLCNVYTHCTQYKSFKMYTRRTKRDTKFVYTYNDCDWAYTAF